MTIDISREVIGAAPVIHLKLGFAHGKTMQNRSIAENRNNYNESKDLQATPYL